MIVKILAGQISSGDTEDGGFEYEPWGFVVVFLRPSRQIMEQYPNLSQDRIFPNSFQIIAQ
jgi:hypothetical protein